MQSNFFVILVFICFQYTHSMANDNSNSLSNILYSIRLVEKGTQPIVPGSKGFKISVRLSSSDETSPKDTVYYTKKSTNGICTGPCSINLKMIDTTTYLLVTNGIGVLIHVEYTFKLINNNWYLTEIFENSPEGD